MIFVLIFIFYIYFHIDAKAVSTYMDDRGRKVRNITIML